MRLNSSMLFMSSNIRKFQKGSSLVIAIFILVVMSLLGAALLKIIATNEDAYAYEVLGTRAYNAAQSGVQCRLQTLFPLNTNATPAMCLAEESLALNTVKGLGGCKAIVQCTRIEVNSVHYFTIISKGECEINNEVTSRVVEVQAKSLN